MSKRFFLSFLSLIIISEAYSSQDRHRDPQSEGWAWSRSLRYGTDLDFTSVHLDMKEQEKRLRNLESGTTSATRADSSKSQSTRQKNMDSQPKKSPQRMHLEKKNICQIRFSLILKNRENGSRKQIDMIELQKGDPFQNHMFISGSVVKENDDDVEKTGMKDR